MAEPDIRRIGVLTSGGDCAGLNAAIRAVVKRAVSGYGWEVLGIQQGTRGLMARPVDAVPLGPDLFTGELLRRGGTMLGTVTSGDPFRFPTEGGPPKDRSGEVVEGIEQLGLDAVIGIGGDGSMRILSRLARQGGYPFIGIPKTIDNDVAGTDFAIGFHTAVSTAVEALDRLQPTAASHQRVMILEVMGRDAGHIALAAGIAGGADAILIPEIPYRIEPVLEKLEAVRAHGRNHALVVCAEAARPENFQDLSGLSLSHASQGAGHVLGEQISNKSGADTRVTVLGHVQRGGIPTSLDRFLASAFGTRAVDLVAGGQTHRMVAWSGGDVTDVALADVVDATRLVEASSTPMITARGLDICLGD